MTRAFSLRTDPRTSSEAPHHSCPAWPKLQTPRQLHEMGAARLWRTREFAIEVQLQVAYDDRSDMLQADHRALLAPAAQTVAHIFVL